MPRMPAVLLKKVIMLDNLDFSSNTSGSGNASPVQLSPIQNQNQGGGLIAQLNQAQNPNAGQNQGGGLLAQLNQAQNPNAGQNLNQGPNQN